MAQGKGRKRSDSHTFLFINRDASTINRSGKDLELDRVIQSHVQRGVRRKLRLDQEKTSRKRGSPSPNKRASQQASSEPAQRGSETILPSQDAAYWGSATDASFLDFTTDAHVDDALFSEFVSPSVTPSPPSQHFISNPPSPPHNFALTYTNYADASSTSHDLLTQHAPAFLHYWTNVLLPEMFPFDTRTTKLGRSRHAPAIHAELQEVTSSPTHLHSLCGAIAVATLARNGTLALPNMTSFEEIEMIIAFKTHAQTSIRAALTSDALLEPPTCRALQRLTAIAFLTDNPAAATANFQTMMAAVTALGGLPSFPSYFIESEIIIHWYAALRDLKKPAINLWSVVAEPPEVARFRAPRQQTHSHSQSQSRSLSRTRTAHGQPGMVAMGANTQLAALKSPALRACLADLALVLRFAAYVQARPYDAEHAKWLALTHLGVGFRLLELHVPVLGQGHSWDGEGREEERWEEVVRIAAVGFVALTRGAEMDRRCAGKGVGVLREVLGRWVQVGDGDGMGWLGGFEDDGVRRAGIRMGRGHRNFVWVLWCAIVGALVAEGTSDKAWFVGVAARAARSLGVGTMEEMEGVLETVVYDRATLGEGVRRLWEGDLGMLVAG